MTRAIKPRFHDEESFGPIGPDALQSAGIDSVESRDSNVSGQADLIESARRHFSNQNVKAGVDDIILAYEKLAKDKATLTAMRNQAFRDLSTRQGWQASPHPQALRLKRSTPSLPIRSTVSEKVS